MPYKRLICFRPLFFFSFLFFVFFFCAVGLAVRITKFEVPTSYVIEDEENPGELILDCAYETEPNEKGVVLRWLLNGTLIYQWIPGEVPLPHTFVSIMLYALCIPFNQNDFCWSMRPNIPLARFINYNANSANKVY